MSSGARSKPTRRIHEWSNITLEDSDVIAREDRHIGCCGHPCALAGVDHSRNSICCICEACLYNRKVAELHVCLTTLRCGHLCSHTCAFPMQSHDRGHHISADQKAEYHRSHSHKSVCAGCVDHVTKRCTTRLPCGHLCDKKDHRFSAKHDHTSDCDLCRVRQLDALFGADAPRTSLLLELPRDVLIKIMQFLGQSACNGCFVVTFGSQLRPVETPEDLHSGWNGPYCKVPSPCDTRLWYAAQPKLDTACGWRWLPLWYREKLARDHKSLKDGGSEAALISQLDYRLRANGQL